MALNCLWNKWNFYTVQFYLWEEGPQPIHTISLLWMSISQFQTWNRTRPLGCFRKENEKDVTKCVIQFFQIKQPPFLDSEYRQDFHQSLVCVETWKCRSIKNKRQIKIDSKVLKCSFVKTVRLNNIHLWMSRSKIPHIKPNQGPFAACKNRMKKTWQNM